MEIPAAPVPHHPGRSRLLGALLAGAVLLILLIAYVGGFANLRDENGFSERRVSFVWRDASLDHVLGELFPALEVRFPESPDTNMHVTWKTEAMSEREVVRELAELSNLRIRRLGDAVVVSWPSWTWHRYDAWDRWFRERCGFSPWGRPPPLRIKAP